MTDADELAKLAEMHATGSLTDAEFTTAKARLLRDASPGDPSAYGKSHRGRWAVVAGIVALIGFGATAAIVASGSDASTTKAESTQPTTGPTSSHPPLILAPTTRPNPTPTTVSSRQQAMDAFVSIQRGYNHITATLGAPYSGKTMTAEEFVKYCSLFAEPYASWATSLRDETWPTYASTQISKLADYYNIIAGFYTECSTTDPASPRMQDLNRQHGQLVASLVVLEFDAAATLGWTACADGSPPCYP